MGVEAMRAFRLVESEEGLVVVVTDRKLAAAVRAFDYAWQEMNDGKDRTDILIETLGRVYTEDQLRA